MSDPERLAAIRQRLDLYGFWGSSSGICVADVEYLLALAERVPHLEQQLAQAADTIIGLRRAIVAVLKELERLRLVAERVPHLEQQLATERRLRVEDVFLAEGRRTHAMAQLAKVEQDLKDCQFFREQAEAACGVAEADREQADSRCQTLEQEVKQQRARAVVAEQHKTLSLLGKSSWQEVVEEKLRTELAETQIRAETAEADREQALKDLRIARVQHDQILTRWNDGHVRLQEAEAKLAACDALPRHYGVLLPDSKLDLSGSPTHSTYVVIKAADLDHVLHPEQEPKS